MKLGLKSDILMCFGIFINVNVCVIVNMKWYIRKLLIVGFLSICNKEVKFILICFLGLRFSVFCLI